MDFRKRSIEMHRRAQKAEGLLKKLLEAHDTGVRYANKDPKHSPYMYAAFVKNHYKRIWERARLFLMKGGDAD